MLTSKAVSKEAKDMTQNNEAFPRNLSRPEHVTDSLEYVYFAFSRLEEIIIDLEHIRGMRIEGDEVCLVLDNTNDARFIAEAELLVLTVRHRGAKNEEVYPMMGHDSLAKRGINQWRCSVVRDDEILVWFKVDRSRRAMEGVEDFLIYGVGHHSL